MGALKFIMVKLPHKVSPCKNCPFKKDTLKGWLGSERMTEIINYHSFVCHKDNSKQCAGHMILNGDKNAYVRLAHRMKLDLKLINQDLVFDTAEECIKHHDII